MLVRRYRAWRLCGRTVLAGQSGKSRAIPKRAQLAVVQLVNQNKLRKGHEQQLGSRNFYGHPQLPSTLHFFLVLVVYSLFYFSEKKTLEKPENTFTNIIFGSMDWSRVTQDHWSIHGQLSTVRTLWELGRLYCVLYFLYWIGLHCSNVQHLLASGWRSIDSPIIYSKHAYARIKLMPMWSSHQQERNIDETIWICSVLELCPILLLNFAF